MGNYLRGTLFECDFDGDKVSARLKPIEQGDALEIYTLRGEADNADLNAKLLPIFARLVPKYAEEFKCPRAADGSEVTLDEVARIMYFSPLLTAMGWALVNTGKLRDPKAPASPLVVSSAE